MLKKIFKFVTSKENDIIAFNFSLVLLYIKVDPILEEKSYKKDTLVVCNTNYIKIIFALLTKIVISYIKVFIK